MQATGFQNGNVLMRDDGQDEPEDDNEDENNDMEGNWTNKIVSHLVK